MVRSRLDSRSPEPKETHNGGQSPQCRSQKSLRFPLQARTQLPHTAVQLFFTENNPPLDFLNASIELCDATRRRRFRRQANVGKKGLRHGALPVVGHFHLGK